MKKYILIFAKTKYAKTPYDLWLKQTNIEPIILTTKEFAGGYSHMANVYSFENYDHNRMVEKTALEIGRSFNLIGVFARAEADVIRAAQLREELGLPGQQLESAIAFRNKVVMKNYLKESGVELPVFTPVSSGYDIIKFIETHGYPVVVKPYAESGSFGTSIITNEAELNQHLSETDRADLEVETFIDGEMYHVDGLIKDGKIVFIHPFKYINTCLSFRNDEFVGTLALEKSNVLFEPLVNAAQAVLKHLPLPQNTTFHTELWVKKDGGIAFCEIASRTGGGMISSVIQHSFGIDLDKEWLLAECGIESNFDSKNFRPAGGLMIPPSKGLLEKLPEENKPVWVLESQHTGVVGQRFNGGVKSGLFLSGFVISGQSENEVTANMIKTVDWYASEAKWS